MKIYFMNNHLMCDGIYFLTGSCCAASWPELRPGCPPETPPHRSVSSCPVPSRRARADTWWKTRLLMYLLPQETATPHNKNTPLQALMDTIFLLYTSTQQHMHFYATCQPKSVP